MMCVILSFLFLLFVFVFCVETCWDVCRVISSLGLQTSVTMPGMLIYVCTKFYFS